MLVGGVLSLLTVVVPTLLNAYINNGKIRAEVGKARAEEDQIDLSTIVTLKKQVNELIIESQKQHEQIVSLNEKVRKISNAYARALKYIYEKLQPGDEVPNFMDTGPLVMDRKPSSDV